VRFKEKIRSEEGDAPRGKRMDRKARERPKARRNSSIRGGRGGERQSKEKRGGEDTNRHILRSNNPSQGGIGGKRVKRRSKRNSLYRGWTFLRGKEGGFLVFWRGGAK